MSRVSKIETSGASSARPGLGPRRSCHRLLILLGFTNLAVAQPLYDLLGRETDFLVAHDSAALDLLMLVGALSFGIALFLFAVGQLVDRVRRGGWVIAHYPAIFILATLLAAQAWRRFEAWPAALVLFLAATTAGVLVALLARSQLFRQFAVTLSVVSLAIPFFFLFRSEIRALWLPTTGATDASRPRITSKTPVVLVVFDELPVSSLMKTDETLDAERFPHFADLASTSNWYRRATTVAEPTVVAVPAILTGMRPRERKTATATSHPHNLFTWLGSTYRVIARESITRLCPEEICGTDRRPGFSPRLALLFDDLSVLYARRIVPAEWATRLPEVNQSWRAFRDRSATTTEDVPSSRNVPRLLEHFLSQIDGAGDRTLFYFHPNLPHVPWRYLPNGQEYGPIGELRIEGLSGEQWRNDEWPTVQAFQRHLLQVAYTDRVLGRLLGRLRTAGVFDRALVIVTADHGVSFVPGASRRDVGDRNLEDVLEVPLFLKLPEQTAGRVLDQAVETIDILPTIAEVLGISPPRPTDGRSLLDDTARSRQYLAGPRQEGELRPVQIQAQRRRRSLERKAQLFGEGDLDQLYRIGRTELLDRPLADFTTISSSLRVEINDAPLLNDVDLESTFLPARIFGRIRSDDAQANLPSPAPELVISINGQIAATTFVTLSSGMPTFSAIVPPRMLREGRNDLQIHLLEEGGTGLRLAALVRQDRKPARIVFRAGRAQSIVTSTGRELPLVFGATQGRASTFETRIAGWALDPVRRQPFDELFIFVDGVNVFEGVPRRTRQPRVIKRFGTEAVAWSGFEVPMPAEKLAESTSVRVFARSGSLASDLAASWRWPSPDPGERVQFSISRRPGRKRRRLQEPDGALAPIFEGAVMGVVDYLKPLSKNRMRIGGWAFDESASSPAREIVVTVNGKADHYMATRWARRDVETLLSSPTAAASGFLVDLPRRLFNGTDRSVIRVFAIGSQGRASELHYFGENDGASLKERLGHR